MTARAPQSALVPPGQIAHAVSDLTVTASATCTLAELQSVLAKHNQWLPIAATLLSLGLLVSSNSTGPLRLGFGAWRDLLLGCQFLSGRDDLITAGGQTMKNVAGYDLTKLMVGSSNHFGHLLTLTTRTYARPSSALLVTFAPDIPVLNSLLPTAAKPHWSLLTNDALLCGYLGDRDTIHFHLKNIRAHDPLEIQQQAIEDDIALRTKLWRFDAADPELAFRASAPPSRLYDLVRALKPPQWIADPAFGILIGTCPSKAHTSAWQSLAASMSARITFRHPTIHELVAYSTSPEEKRIIDSLKKAFDPRGQLTPLPR